MRTIILTIIPTILFLSLNAQKHDNIWLFGYESDTNTPGWGGTNIEFDNTNLNIYQQYRDMYFSETNASICDTEGNLLFYTNGIYIANQENEPMDNGLGLNPGQYALDHTTYGYILPQGALILPQPEHENIYYLFHKNMEYPSDSLEWHSSILYYSIVDMNENNGLGKVIEKNQIIIQDTLITGKITATKHANGRDWWILSNELNSNLHYRTLLSPNGLSQVESQYVGTIVPRGLGQAVFSPDGSTFVLFSVDVITTGFLNIYDFDRCTGELSNHLPIVITEEQMVPGIAISASSQFLYVSVSLSLYQYDLWAEDIAASKTTVAVYDGFTAPFATVFYLSQLAPDGKIYINAFSGADVLHVIHEPDLRGEACNVEQHGIDLPTYNAGSMPNFPNYRLGALADSPCDTLINSTTALPTNTQHIQLYPNPAQHQVQLTLATPFSKTVDVDIIDVLGNVVGRDVLAARVKEIRLSLEGLVAGIYFISIKTPDGTILSQKLLISQ